MDIIVPMGSGFYLNDITLNLQFVQMITWTVKICKETSFGWLTFIC